MEKLLLFFLLSWLSPLDQKYIAICVCLNRRVPELKERGIHKQEKKDSRGQPRSHGPIGLTIFSFTTFVSFISCFSWDFSSNHTQMNFHQFTSPRGDWCELVAKTCCCLDLFSPVLFWWWDSSLQLDLRCEQVLQSSLCYSLMVKLFLQTGLWQFDDIWVHGKVKIWLPKSTVITVNSYILHCSYRSTLQGNFSISIPKWQTAKQMERDRGRARKRIWSSGWVPSPCCILVLVKVKLNTAQQIAGVEIFMVHTSA